MKKTINVESTFNDMRIDRLIRNHLGKIPQALLEKSLRNGKIKLNYKRVKSSKKVKIGDQINFFKSYFRKTQLIILDLLFKYKFSFAKKHIIKKEIINKIR